MTTAFWEWMPLPGGGHELWKEGRRVFTLDVGGTIRDLSTPAGLVVGDLVGPFAGAVRFSSTAYIATLDLPSGRLRVRSGDRITRVDLHPAAGNPAPSLTPRWAAGLDLPPGSPHRTARTGQSGVCVMESGTSRSVCAFDDPTAFDPELAFAAFTATSKP